MRVVLVTALGLLVFACALPLFQGIAGVYDAPNSHMFLRWSLSSLLAVGLTGAIVRKFWRLMAR